MYSVIGQLAEEAYKSREGIEASPEEWMALYIGEFAHLVIHEAAAVANAAVSETGGDGDAIYKRIVSHFEESEDENTEEELPED